MCSCPKPIFAQNPVSITMNKRIKSGESLMEMVTQQEHDKPD